jgi:hypothetical protein
MRNVSMGCACVLLAAGSLGLAHAGSPGAATPSTKPPRNVQHRAPTHATHSVAAFGSKASAATLAKMSGGSDVTTRVTLHGNVSDSTTKNVVTGTNSIAGHAFDHAVGLPVVIQNSGNSVVIQNATTLNLQLQP